MVAIKSLVLFALFQGAQSFCVYNHLHDGTSITAHQDITGIPLGKSFLQFLEPSAKACCHYTNKDCSPNQKDDDLAKFLISIHGPSGTFVTFAKCSTGGALSIHGSVFEPSAECIYVNGNRNNYYLPQDPW